MSKWYSFLRKVPIRIWQKLKIWDWLIFKVIQVHILVFWLTETDVSVAVAVVFAAVVAVDADVAATLEAD